MEDVTTESNAHSLPDHPLRIARPPQMENYKWKSDYHRDESIYVSSYLEHIVFDASKDDALDLEDFLQEYQPSVVQSYDDVGHIWVLGPNHQTKDRAYSKGILEVWDSIKDSGQKITTDTVLQLAQDHGETGGKWMIHVESGIKADLAWARVARIVASGNCGDSAAIITKSIVDPLIRKAILVFNDDFSYVKVCEIDEKIREAGIKGEMKYKPDIFTTLGIFRENEWYIRPTIYLSHYDVIKRRSVVKETKELYSNNETIISRQILSWRS